MTFDEFSGGVGAEASQQLAEGRRRAEDVGSTSTGHGLLRHRWSERITS